MARMYSRKHGKSGSKKPVVKAVPSWSRYNAKEVELLVTKLAKTGLTGSQIGAALRDAYGIPNVKIFTKKRISELLADKQDSQSIPEDLMALMKKAVRIKKHMQDNNLDQPARRGLKIAESKINKLAAYYKRIGKLQLEWKYDPERLRMIFE